MLSLRTIKIFTSCLLFVFTNQAFGQIDTPDLARYIVEGGNTITGHTTLIRTQFDDSGGVYCLLENSNRPGSSYPPHVFSLVKFNAKKGVLWKKSFYTGDLKSSGNYQMVNIGIRGNNIIYSGVGSDSISYDSFGVSVVRRIGTFRAYFLNYDLQGNFIRYGELNDSFDQAPLLSMTTDSTVCMGFTGFDFGGITLVSIHIKSGAVLWEKRISTTPITSFARCQLLSDELLGLSCDGLGNIRLNIVTFYVDTLKIENDTALKLNVKWNGFSKFQWLSFNGNGKFQVIKTRKKDVFPQASAIVGENIYDIIYAKNYRDLSLDSNSFFVTGIVDTNVRLTLVKYDSKMNILGAKVFESNPKNGHVASIGSLGDTTLLLFGRTTDTFDLDPSKFTERIIKYDLKDPVDGFILVLDSSMKYKTHYKFDYGSDAITHNLDINGNGDNQLIIGATLGRGELDIDIGPGVEKVALKKYFVTICAIYHLDSLGGIDTITGPKGVCWSVDSVFTYSVPAVKNAYWYDWDLPAGTQIVGKDSLRTIQVKFTKDFGTHQLSVTARRNGQNVQSKILAIQTTNTQANYSFAAGSSHICVGDRVLITGNSTGVEYNHYLNGTLLRSDANPNFRADTLADGDLYFQIVRRSNGCLAQTKSIIFKVDTPIKPLLIVPKSLCQDAALNIRMLETDSFYIYQNQDIIYKGIKRTWRFYKYKANDIFWGLGIDSNGCRTLTDTHSIKINPLPLVSAGNDTAICIGDSMQLVGKGALSYTWQPKPISNGDYIKPTKNSSYILVGKGSNNCEASDTLKVSINQLPQITARPDTALCMGDSLKLFASGAVYYNWGNIGTNLGYFQPKAEASYLVLGTDQNGCKNKDSFSVKLYTLPKVYAGADAMGCLGDKVRLFANFASTYKWSDGLANGHDHQIIKDDTLWVEGTDSRGCTAIDSLFITAYPDPVFTKTADTAICTGEGIKLEANGPHTFLWSDGLSNGGTAKPIQSKTYFVIARDNSTNCTSRDSVQISLHAKPNVKAGLDEIICVGDTIYPAATGATSYSWSHGQANETAYQPKKNESLVVIGTDGNGCSNQDTLNIKVHQLPKPNLGSDQSMSRDDTLSFYPGSFEQYRWQNQSNDSLFRLNGREIDTGQYLVFVFVTDKNGCSNADSVRIQVGPSGREEVRDFGLRVYPNPAKNVIFIESQHPISSYKLFDLNGKKVGEGLLQKSIEVSHLSPGVYRMQVLGSDNVSRGLSFVIQ